MLQNKNIYAKDLADLISRNVQKPKKVSKLNRKHLSGTVDLKNRSQQPSTIQNDPYYSSDDELKGRSVIQEVDYQDPKKAMKQIQNENLKNLIQHKRKQSMTLRKIKEIDDSALNMGPRTNRTSRTINASSVASKRKSIIDDYNHNRTEISPAKERPTEIN